MSWEIAFIVGSLIFALVVIVGANVWAVMDTPPWGPDERMMQAVNTRLETELGIGPESAEQHLRRINGNPMTDS